jgi:hypothetical protein
MAYFWGELDFLEGGRFTTVSYMALRQWPHEVDKEIVLLGQFIWLPPGQHVDLEEDFLGSHLPYRRAMFGGVDNIDEPWLFAIQAAPRSVVHDVFGPDADPYEVMREAMTNALEYNAGAHVAMEAIWDRRDLKRIYRARSIHKRHVQGWSTFDLLRGLLAELTGADLGDIVAGYPECAFAGRRHECQHDVFDDTFVAWAARQHP